VIRASGGEMVGPFCEVRSKQGAGKSKVQDAGTANKHHGKTSKDTRGV